MHMYETSHAAKTIVCEFKILNSLKFAPADNNVGRDTPLFWPNHDYIMCNSSAGFRGMFREI